MHEKNYFTQFDPEIIKTWEKAVTNDPNAKWNDNQIKPLLPFIRLKPRISNTQSLFGLTLICIEGKINNEKEIIEFGLEPLVEAQIVTKQDMEQILNWYQTTEPNWDSNNSNHYEKQFTIEEIKYRLFSDCYRNCRDIILGIVKN